MNANQVRKQFLDFFESKGHKIVSSAPIVVKNDPTLMFTNAGMNQFKDWFLGNEEPKYKRVADTQKCLRVSGKHNDLEEVGVDTYHHTMFEMLGNWSFGDYFKKEAIEWAWELLTEVYKLPKDRLYVSVFEGDEKEKLAFDQEAYDNWCLWIDPKRILNGNKKDNFWEMGDTGPCGPCSEIHIDLRSDEERKQVDGKTLVNNDHPQVIEIWNNVFMEFNRKADGSLEKLPAQHVDTGMGFERLCRAIEAKSSNYDTDVFMPYIRFIELHSGFKYHFSDSDDKKHSHVERSRDIAMRVLADHIRTITFAILDGQLPSNTGAGYVIRRILRRAVRYYYSFLDVKEPYLYKMVALVAESFNDIFPEVKQKQSFIESVVKEEELGFLKTLERGILKINDLIAGTQNADKNNKQVSGFDAFELLDTYGFPIDLTQLIAKENGFEVDMPGFETELQKQKTRSRNAAALETEDWVVLEDNDNIQFIGYDVLEADIKIMRYRKVKSKGKSMYQLVFNQTPFYAESGGQVGDMGIIESINERIAIIDTQKENNLIIHITTQLPENPAALFTAKVDVQIRKLTEANHSATHLLHAALRKVLGPHVEQKGSLVNSEYLRFDFSHFKGMRDEEISEVEQIVNQKIRENILLDEHRYMPIEEAKKLGAMALFGEKYGDMVRVITFDEKYSRELCGGTHVKATGQIGLFKITAESAIAAGVRRIEAITADGAEHWVNQQQSTLNSIAELLKVKDISKAVEQLIAEKSELLKKLELLEGEKTRSIKSHLKTLVQHKNGISVLIQKVEIPSADQLKNLSFQLRNEIENLYCVLACELNGKPMLSIILSDNIVAEHKLHAGSLVKTFAKHIQGGGGGQPFYATAGGNNSNGIEAALKEAFITFENIKTN
ncbi:MAG: alanine--tRNA ligase [Bacteroidota bacterium]|nr:alanine--tRNA ligase [Bacteroidota bacterium]